MKMNGGIICEDTHEKSSEAREIHSMIKRWDVFKLNHVNATRVHKVMRSNINYNLHERVIDLIET